MIRCSFCGHTFSESDSKSSCAGCPMSRNCNKSKCPNCGYEILKEPKLIKFLRRKWGKKND